ncbi:hypothetical protein BDZ91DRAFT_847275 [Kalaharituber pfeilii]|nr:hypothetical protein BDZ91DRAFT_847275 [Kalaharituber pfeilii]
MSSSSDPTPQTPVRHKLRMAMETTSPCPSTSTSEQSVYEESNPSTPQSGIRTDATVAERRGILCHEGGVFDDDDQLRTPPVQEGAQLEMDAKTPKQATKSSPADSATNQSVTSNSSSVISEDELSRRGLPSACVFVANLAATRTDDELKKSLQARFGRFGRLHVKIRRDEKGNPYSFVQFENDQHAKRAIREGRGAVIDGSGRRIRCEPAKVNRTLLLSKLDNGVFDEKDARKALFGFGELESVEFISGKYIAARGIRNGAFIRFVYRQDAVDCHQYFHSHNVWSVEWANNTPPAQNSNIKTSAKSPNATVDPRSIFIGQLNPESITKDILLERFSKYGTIVNCNLVIKPAKFGLGKNAFAFIKYDDHLSATRAIDQENNCPFLGKIIHVQRREFHDKPNSMSSAVENPFNQIRLTPAGDGRSNTVPPISFSVADVADLAARLTLNYATHANFNPRQPSLSARQFNAATTQAPVFFPWYAPFYYGPPAGAAAATPTSPGHQGLNEGVVGLQDHSNISQHTGFYPQSGEQAQTMVPSPELLRAHFNPLGAHYDNQFAYQVPASNHFPIMGQSSGVHHEQRFQASGYGNTERYDGSIDNVNQNMIGRSQHNN